MIILLDLNFTLVANSDQRRAPFIRQIEQETYRHELIERIRPYRVFMLTARPERYRDATLASILAKTGWAPERAYFNHYGEPPPIAKTSMLKEIMPELPGETFFGIESNPRTRAAYAALGIPSQPWTTQLRLPLP